MDAPFRRYQAGLMSAMDMDMDPKAERVMRQLRDDVPGSPARTQSRHRLSVPGCGDADRTEHVSRQTEHACESHDIVQQKGLAGTKTWVWLTSRVGQVHGEVEEGNRHG